MSLSKIKVLIVHNLYKQKGGEDAVVANEYALLEKDQSVDARLIYFNNNEINSFPNRLKMIGNSVYNSASVKRIREELADFKPDVIHIHNLFYLLSPSILFWAKKKGIPVVITLHNFRLICVGSTLLRDDETCKLCIESKIPLHGIRHKCFQNSAMNSTMLTASIGIHKLLGTWKNRVTRFISLTPFTRQTILNSSLELDKHQIVVKPNSVEDCGEGPYSKRKNYFLFVGRLSKEKGVNTLLEAFEKTRIDLYIAGDGPLRESAEHASQTNPNIRYLGRQSKEQILILMKRAQALVFPSIWYEGLPMVILEAFSTGTPVIASNIENINQIVSDGVNGIHFQTSDANSLKEVLKSMHENPGKHKDLYHGARATFLNNYTPQSNLEQLKAIYDEAINCSSLKT